MDELREHLDVLDWRRWQNAMAEVKNVSRAAADAVEDVFGAVEHPARRPEQQRRIQIALHGAIEADVFPRLVDRHAPIDADHIATRLAQFLEHRGGAGTEVNGRY